MKYILILIALSLSYCTPSVTLPTQTSTNVTPNANAKYFYMGTEGLYASATDAYNNRNSGRPYYRDLPVIEVGMSLYNSQSTTDPIKGNNQWVCITTDNGQTWVSLQINSFGLIVKTN